MRRAKVVDEIFAYQGRNSLMGHCRVRIYTGPGLVPLVLVSECDNNPGTSITGAAPELYPRLIAKFLPGWLDQAEDLILVEHYPGHQGEWGKRQVDTFDLVTFTHWKPRIRYMSGVNHVMFGDPEWRPFGESRLRELVEDIG